GITGRRGLLAHGLGGVEQVFRGGQMVPQRAEEEAREEPFVGESLGPRGEVVLQDGGIFLRHGGEGRVPMEILDRVAVLDEGEIIAFVRLNLLVSGGWVCMSRLS